MKQTTIKITTERDDKEQQIDVRICYCAATERGFEEMSGKNVNIFWPTFGKDEEGKDVVKEPPTATNSDYITLALAGIVAAYAAKGEESPVTSADILYHATPTEVTTLITTIIQLRNDWYGITKVVKDMLDAEKPEGNKQDEGEKNS